MPTEGYREQSPPPGWASLVLLLGANLLPVGFLVFGDWSPGDVLLMFWLENVVVGIFTLVKIMTARGGSGEPGTGTGSRVALCLFFTFHFGIFTIVHGVFTALLAFWIGLSGDLGQWSVVALGLVLSHGVSLVVWWFYGPERERTSPKEAMAAPYSRVMVLHFVVLASAFLLFRLGSGGDLGPDDSDRLLPALLLIAIKTAVDVVAHVRAHRQGRSGVATAGPAPAARAG